MQEKHIDFLRNLTKEIGPSGQEFKVQRIFKNYVTPYSDDINVTKHHAVIAQKKGKNNFSVMLAGHADEISMLVSYIDDKGFIYVTPMGGIDAALLPGQKVFIVNKKNVVKGVFGRKPKHLIKDNSSDVKIEDLWIDIGTSGKDETMALVSLGDVVIWDSEFHIFNHDRVISKAFDDRIAVYIIARVLEELHNYETYANIFCVSTTQEEVGARGAKTASNIINPDISIAIDVTFASDHPGMNSKENGDIKLGEGPVLTIGSRINPELLEILKDVAKENEIPLQYEIWTRQTGTDLDQMHESADGSAGLLVSIPCRYMHSANEMISFNDAENTVKLLVNFLKKLHNTDFLNII